jgi:Protein of unknown function (DUF642)
VKRILSAAIATAGIALAMAAASATPAHANLLTNGSFETTPLSGGFVDIPSGFEPTGFGWTVKTNSVNVYDGTLVFGSFFTAFDGNLALDLVGSAGAATLSQMFSTVAGETYTLTFAYSEHPSAPFATAGVAITDGLNSLLDTTITHSTSSTADPDWTIFTATFVATGTSATLDFTNLVGFGTGGILLDAVSIVEAVPSEVPAPATVSLLGAGLAAIGAVRRRHRSQAQGTRNPQQPV